MFKIIFEPSSKVNELEKHAESWCLSSGQVFAAVKMFGRQLPWDVDLDVDVAKVFFINNLGKLKKLP